MAIRPVVVSFQAEGVRDIQQAFRSVERSLVDMDKATAKSSQRTARERERDFQRSSKTIERTGQTEAASFLKNEAAKAKASARAAKEAEKAYEKLFAEQDRKEQASVKAHEKAERQKVRESRQAAKDWEKIVQDSTRTEKQATRDLEREHQKRLRFASQQAKVGYRESQQEAASAYRVRGQYASFVGRTTQAGLGAVSNLASTALSLGGGISLADAFQSTVATRGAAANLAVQTKDGKGQGGMSADAIYRRAVEIGKQTGMSSGDVVKGMDQYFAKSGDSESMMANIADLAKIARVTGSDLGELGAQAGNYQNNTKNSAQTMNWIKTTAGMGRAGSVDARELAQYGARLSSSTNEFKDKNSAFSTMSAIVQQAAATGGSSSAAEATESLVHFGTDIQKGRAEFKAKGIDVMSSDGKTLADPRQIIRQTLSKTGGDSKQLLDLFGARSYRAVSGYADVYRTAQSAAKDSGLNTNQQNAAGLKAVDDAMGKFLSATLTETSIRTGMSERMKEADARLEAALTDMRDAIGTKLVPVIADKLLPAIQSVIPAFANMVGYVANNPLKGMGILVSAAMTKEISSAMIGKVLTDAVKMNAAGQIAGGLVLGTVTAVTIHSIGKMLIDSEMDRRTKNANDAVAADLAANEAGGNLRILTALGTVDEKAVSAAVGTQDSTKANLDKQLAYSKEISSTSYRATEGAELGAGAAAVTGIAMLLGGPIAAAGMAIGSSFGIKGVAEGEQKNREQAVKEAESTMASLGKLDNAIRNATTSMQLMADAAGKGKPSPSSPDRAVPMTER